jgi:glyoxylase-like metal-dependent hydrolase (beta-lactamase superfamily II)
VRAVAVHPDVVVVTSRLWQTTATAIRAPSAGANRPSGEGVSGEGESVAGAGGSGSEEGEAFLVDSPYFPDELELLPALLEQSGFRIQGLISTHADFDHLLGRLAFPDHTLGVGEPTMARIRAEPGTAQRELREADAEHYVVRPRPLALGGPQALPVPGYVDVGNEQVELHPTEGHTADGLALFARFAGVLVCGDYLSDVEIPMISPGGSLRDYRTTLARLAPLVEAADVVVPGHGSPHERERALAILDEDLEYLDALEEGAERPALPAGRDTRRQRAIHADNLKAA